MVISSEANTASVTVRLVAEGAQELFGIRDENLKTIRKAFGVRLSARGQEVRVEGPAESVATVEHLFSDLSRLLEMGHRFQAEDIASAVRVLEESPRESIVDFLRPEGLLGAVCQKVAPRGLRQQLYLKAMTEFDIVISIGPAGTGKTYLAVAMAAAALQANLVRRIILARPAVEAGEKLGFLPGDLVEKVNPYLRPLYDALYDIIGFEQVSRLLDRGTIEVAPIAFMRGRTLNDSFVILDEAQNTTSEQMKMFLTRIGFNSKAVVNGDVTQVDLARGQVSGLKIARQVLDGVEGIKFVSFTERDVVRHRLVQKVIKAYERYERRQAEAPQKNTLRAPAPSASEPS